jgi:[acyl-carrier-protein] S-malonyltransferase
MAIAFVFPGQGSQAVGMGKALAEAFAPARAVFDEVDAALGEKLTSIMWEGPADRLTLTENAQPALMAVSLAALRVLQAEAGLDLKRDVQFVAGHSLGEYSALAAAGAFTISDTAKLLRIRGRAMQQAVPVGTGAMAALLGLSFEEAAAVAKPRKARSATSPTTTAAGRSWCRVIRRRWSARSRSPRSRVPSARCCCPCPHPSIVR